MSQELKVLEMLKRGPVTPLQALRECGSLRLGARIHALRGKGYSIQTDMIEVSGNKRVARYTLKNKRPPKGPSVATGKGS
jgi:hypothetical protein